MLANNEWWLREAAKAFRAASLGNMADDAAYELAAELDNAGLSEVWRPDAAGAVHRQIVEWNEWARQA